ncbi:MAG: nucleotidyltransferase [Sphingobacteriales bacterium]|nr:nucleotidyltransferase [Sphingobacteriales bacterium]
MARTIDYWYSQIIAQKEATSELDVLTSTSKVAIWRLFAYVVAVVIWSLDKLFDIHKAEIDDLISLEKAHRLQWYRQKALAFRLGQDLIDETDQYDNTGLTDADIEALQIIKQAAVNEIKGQLRLKVVSESGGEYQQLDEGQLLAFTDYMERIKDAGERIKYESLPPDDLKLNVDIFYNPLVLKSDGSRIDGASTTPIPDAIRAHLKNLRFSGEYANSRLHTALTLVDGVVLPVVKSAQAKYGLFPFTTIDERYIPDAGYLELTDINLTINYREYGV